MGARQCRKPLSRRERAFALFSDIDAGEYERVITHLIDRCARTGVEHPPHPVKEVRTWDTGCEIDTASADLIEALRIAAAKMTVAQRDLMAG
jgi:hypothetical protein